MVSKTLPASVQESTPCFELVTFLVPRPGGRAMILLLPIIPTLRPWTVRLGSAVSQVLITSRVLRQAGLVSFSATSGRVRVAGPLCSSGVGVTKRPDSAHLVVTLHFVVVSEKARYIQL